MAVLIDQDRADGAADFIRQVSRGKLATFAGILKTDIAAAYNAADSWADQNAASFNAALPVAFRTNAPAALKAFLLSLVIMKRWTKGL